MPGKGKNALSRPKRTMAKFTIITYQVAAYKSANEANKLNAKLEKSRPPRRGVCKSGKVHLVLVKLRGTESDAAKLRARLEKSEAWEASSTLSKNRWRVNSAPRGK